MEKSVFYKQLCSVLAKDQILCDEPMSRHTTFRAGGAADFYVTPRVEQVAEVLALCKKEAVACQVIGNGSNLLVGDLGIRGVVLAFAKQAAAVQAEGCCVRAQAGALLSQAAGAAWKAGLGGLEFAAGIPGSVGGAVVMNAGAYGGECKDVLRQVTALTQEGEVVTLRNTELALSYRHSCIPERGLTVLEAEFALQPKPQEEILALMDDLKKRRAQKQPLEYPSAGSTFKRPEGFFAGKLIMEAGLAGAAVGGAKVSEKHCGFVINAGNASASEILALIRKVQTRVFEHSGVKLEMEVKCMGEFKQEL
ncbi:MAG: UDP-N-acetylmuramate dehydrogenase [Eubacterium sp.]|nr:UDP-N-acetylmuramate dehydrogenase [Eubacterium sp.]